MLSLDTTNATSLWDCLSPDLENYILELAGGIIHREQMIHVLDEMPHFYCDLEEFPRGWHRRWDQVRVYPWGTQFTQFQNPYEINVIPENYEWCSGINQCENHYHGLYRGIGSLVFTNYSAMGHQCWWYDQAEVWGWYSDTSSDSDDSDSQPRISQVEIAVLQRIMDRDSD